MDPLFYNIIITVIAVVYVFTVVAVMNFAVKKGFPQEISRKIVHIAAGSWLISWYFYDASHWTKYLNIVPAFIWTVLLLIKGLTAGKDDEAVKTMTRTGDRRELLKGPFYFTIIMNIMGTVFYQWPMAVTSMAFLGWGDGIAPLAGRYYGKHKYRIVTEKSYEGSAAFLIFGLVAAIFLNYLLIGTADFSKVLLSGVIATLIEAVSPKDIDNFLIPLSVCLIYMMF